MLVDVIILITVIFFTLIGKKRGLALGILSLCSIILSIVLSLTLYRPVEIYLKENTGLQKQINKAITKSISNEQESSKIEEKEASTNVEKNNDGKENSNNGFLGNLISGYINQSKEKIEETKQETVAKVTEDITENIMKVISFVIVYILVTIILLILKIILKVFTKLPIIKQIDKLGGAVLGLAEGVMVIYIVISIISIVAPTNENYGIVKKIDDSYIGSYIYNNNIIKEKIIK